VYFPAVYSVPPCEIFFKFINVDVSPVKPKAMLSFLRHTMFSLGATAFVLSFSSCHTIKKLELATITTDCIQASRQRIHNATYNTKIDFYKKHFSGLLLFKAVNDTDNRVVFVTETGFKLFDFEFTPHNFNIQYCLPPLRKKMILNIFKNDLGQLVQSDTISPLHINQKDSLITFTFARGNNRYEDYSVDSKCSRLTGIERGGKCLKQVTTKISGLTRGNFDEIDIYHRPVKLHISLKQIER
jgi:hypothetical protein